MKIVTYENGQIVKEVGEPEPSIPELKLSVDNPIIVADGVDKATISIRQEREDDLCYVSQRGSER